MLDEPNLFCKIITKQKTPFGVFLFLFFVFIFASTFLLYLVLKQARV